MKIVVASDSFKESLSAERACRAIGRAARRVFPKARVIESPMADGGEGTMAALVRGSGGRVRRLRASDSLGKKIAARYGLIEGGRTAVIEMAEASGLARVPPARRNPLLTSSFGTGELVRDALERGCAKIVLTLGGVATNDAGAGLAEALGFRFLDAQGRPVPRGAGGLAKLSRIDASGAHPRLKSARFLAACDVTNPLCGPRGSAAVYGPQKGATPAMIPRIDRALRRLARIALRDLGADVLKLPGGGAAGGAGAGAAAFLGARLVRGPDLVIDAAGLEKKIQGADWVVTGEGKIDRQTLRYGKGPAQVARIARRRGIPVLGFCGRVEAGRSELRKAGFAAVYAISGGTAGREAFRRAEPLLEAAARSAFLSIRENG